MASSSNHLDELEPEQESEPDSASYSCHQDSHEHHGDEGGATSNPAIESLRAQASLQNQFDLRGTGIQSSSQQATDTNGA